MLVSSRSSCTKFPELALQRTDLIKPFPVSESSKLFSLSTEKSQQLTQNSRELSSPFLSSSIFFFYHNPLFISYVSQTEPSALPLPSASFSWLCCIYLLTLSLWLGVAWLPFTQQLHKADTNPPSLKFCSSLNSCSALFGSHHLRHTLCFTIFSLCLRSQRCTIL